MTLSQHYKILTTALLLMAASFAATANNLPCAVNISQYPPRPAKSSAQPYKYSGNELTENSFSVNHRLRQRMSRDAGKASRRSWIAVGKSQADGGNYDTNNGLNLYDFHARQHDPYTPHFTTIDPLAEVNQGISPYVFCAGNPINYIDPLGLDTINVNQKGEIVSHLKSTEKDKSQRVDIVNIVDNDGNILKDDDGNEISLSLKYKTIESIRTIPKNKDIFYDVYQVRGDSNAKRLFEFFSNNITRNFQIEFSIVYAGLSGDAGKNYITTSHMERTEHGIWQLYSKQLHFGYYIRSIIHSHPNSTKISRSDKTFKEKIYFYQKREIPMYIYYTIDRKYYQY